MQKLLVAFKNSFKYLGAALLIFIPLYPKFPFFRIPGSSVSIRFEDFLVALLGVVVFVSLIPKIKGVAKNKLVTSILIFLLIGLTSLLSGIFLTQTVAPHVGILHFVRRIEYFIPFFASYFLFWQTKDSRQTLEFFIKCLMLVVFISFIYGFGQRYFGWPVIITQNEEYSKGIALRWIPGSHVNSTFAGHYDLATFLVVVLPVFIAAFFVLRGKWSRLALGVSILAGLWLLTNAVSRISVVSYMGAAVLALVLLKKYKQIFLVIFVSLVFFMTSQALMGRYLNLSVYAQEEVQVVEDRSTSIRFNVEWPRAIRAVTKNPLLGTGYSSITLATDNDFLRLLGEVGILGFLAFLLILIRILLIFRRALPIYSKFTGIELAFLAGTVGAFPGVILNSLFIDVFEASKFAIIFWFVIGSALFLIEKRVNEQNN